MEHGGETDRSPRAVRHSDRTARGPGCEARGEHMRRAWTKEQGILYVKQKKNETTQSDTVDTTVSTSNNSTVLSLQYYYYYYSTFITTSLPLYTYKVHRCTIREFRSVRHTTSPPSASTSHNSADTFTEIHGQGRTNDSWPTFST